MPCGFAVSVPFPEDSAESLKNGTALVKTDSKCCFGMIHVYCAAAKGHSSHSISVPSCDCTRWRQCASVRITNDCAL